MPPRRRPTPMLRTSERRDFKRCPQRWWWGWREGYKENGPPDVKLWFGTGWHLVMQHRYQDGLRRGRFPLREWRNWVNDEVVKIRVNDTSGETDMVKYVNAAELGEAMIGGYLDLYGRDEYMHIIQVERTFQVEIQSPSGRPLVIYAGTYDGVYRDLRTEEIWLIEHKSAAQLSTSHLQLDDQAGSYWAVANTDLAADGILDKGTSIKGIMYNFARKALPDDRPVNDKGQATNKPTKQHYLDQLGELGLIDAEAKWTLPLLEAEAERHGVTILGEVSASQPKPLFLREPVYRTRRERRTQVERIANEATHMAAIRNGTLPLYKTPTRDCTWDCPFFSMCQLDEQGGPDAEEFARLTYHREDPYADHRKSAGTLEA